MKKITLFFAAIALAFAAQAQTTYKVLQIHKGTEVTHEVKLSDIDSISFKIVEEEPAIQEHNGHEYVDLGLTSGTLWATCNVGAISPEQYGDYFAWGETAPKTSYRWSDYTYCEGSSYEQTKYCTDSDYGYNEYTDNLVTIEAADDAATANWGGDWRMPTIEELEELRTECIWTWTEDYNSTGVKGCIVTSKQDATKSIFIPAAGFWDGSNRNLNGYGNIWSSSLDESTPYNGLRLAFSTGNDIYTNERYRYVGHSVRAVCSKPAK